MSAMQVKAIEASHIQISIQSCSLALLYYDYILTLPAEIKYIWGSKKLSTFFYFGCRYALVANVVYTLAYLNVIHNRYTVCSTFSSSSCDIGYIISGVLSIIGRASVLSVWGFRTYALYNGSKLILVLFVSLGLACFISDVVHTSGNRCNGKALYPQSDTVLSIVVCCFEFSATLLAIIRSFKTLKDLKRASGWEDSFSYFLLKQGILYTVTVSGFLIAATCLNFLFPESLERRVLNALSLPICGIMTARFLLCLRKRDRGQETQRSEDGEELGQLQFARSSRSIHSGIISEFGEDPVRQQREIASMAKENIDPCEQNLEDKPDGSPC